MPEAPFLHFLSAENLPLLFLELQGWPVRSESQRSSTLSKRFAVFFVFMNISGTRAKRFRCIPGQ